MNHRTLTHFVILIATLWLMALPQASAREVRIDSIAPADTAGCHLVALDTSMGRIVVALYNDTPLHRDNFLRLVRSGWYDGLLFHRVIPGFMIQAGDSASRHALPGQLLGESPESHPVPAEIRFPAHYNRRGALAAAREGDDVNPERQSSESQFYIVTGQPLTDEQLDKTQERLDRRTAGTVKLTPAQRRVYVTEGGAPHLDGQYTVFGQVVEGMDVADRIQYASRDENDRPTEDVRIVKATVIR